MLRFRLLGRSLSLTVLAASVTAAALAQELASAPAEPIQEIIVTGSRIAAPNEQSTSPIEVLSSKYIETSGKTDISDLLMQLPQNFRAGANNVLDKDPPLLNAQLVGPGAANTYDIYDMFGRQLFVGFSAKF